MSALFSPFTVRGTTFRNRIVVSPMCEYSSEDGFANDWHLVHLGSRAVGGAGLVLTEAAAVSPEGRISPQDLGIWKDEHLPMLQRICEFVKAQGATVGIQLAHAGRKASHARPWEGNAAIPPDQPQGWQTLAPSAIPFTPDEPVPTEMSAEDIRQFKADFAAAVERSLQAGFQVIEIHAAHGYLFNEFLSATSNQRTDEYGGSWENRTRLLLEVTRATREQVGQEYPLFVRISATEWVPEGFTDTDAVQLAIALKEAGADLIDCSSGGNAAEQKISTGPLYQTPFAERVRREAGIPTGAVGLITKAAEAESIVAEGRADLVFLARQFLRDPYFPLHAAKELGVDVEWPVQYARAKRH